MRGKYEYIVLDIVGFSAWKQNKTEQNSKIWTQINTPDVFQRCLLNSFLLAGQIDDLRWTLEKLMAFCVPDFFLLPSKTYNCTFVQRLSEAEYHHGYADTLITQKCLHFPYEAVYSCVWSWDECGHTPTVRVTFPGHFSLSDLPCCFHCNESLVPSY